MTLLLAIGCLLSAAAVQPVFQPTMISPNSSDVWTVGEVRSVRWDNDGFDIPSDNHGIIVLSYEDPDTGTSTEWYNQPLASGFSISDEVVNVVVPDVPSGKYYNILLIGDAQNEGPAFTIINPTSPALETGSISFPVWISVATTVPPATVSHWSASTTSGSESTMATTTSSLISSSTSVETTSGAASCHKTAYGGDLWGYLLAAMIGVPAVMAMAV
ncbi:hypothetical protein PYCCODRAFT_1430780 [Trametes coccinea BRFM310]|uniref:Uncharacterized protein n=1 Tax=Trametes coccinea (strain BRFM310) TaxID=1353009 RepID=A0A1Y2J3Z9_TRAC3|nr:hypothetical protein PYCCODRAFT_1430780 [Trametes coccinea BRFM310]